MKSTIKITNDEIHY